MVKIAIAGPGQVAREIIDGLLATGKHEIIILARKDVTPETAIEGTVWVKVDFQDRKALAQALEGVHTVLSFIVAHKDEGGANQKALIDAAIEAGVKRIAPSEWGPAEINHLAWYDSKLVIRKYLEDLNKDKKVIEYSLFQPGWFLELLAGSHKTRKHYNSGSFIIVDHNEGFAHGVGDLTAKVTYTSIQDLVNIVVKAVEYDGEWPKVGGINGHTLSLAEEIAIGERITGKRYEVERLDVEDLKAGVVKTARLPFFDHPSLAELNTPEFASALLAGVLLHIADGHATVSDEWNHIFPDYKLTKVEDFLAHIFRNE